jgi:hypothetical protein
MKGEWEHPGLGCYTWESEKGSIKAQVLQVDELWISRVFYKGEEVDRGEWDSRSVALHNCRGAIDRVMQLRDLALITRDRSQDE